MVVRNRNPSGEKREVHCKDTKVFHMGFLGMDKKLRKGGTKGVSPFLFPSVGLSLSLSIRPGYSFSYPRYWLRSPLCIHPSSI